MPGRVWKADMPLVVKGLMNSQSFLRWKDAIKVGISRAFGIPYTLESGDTWMMTFLSARDTPIVRRNEIWAPDDHQRALKFIEGDCDQNAQLSTEYKSAMILAGDGTIGRAWHENAPAICANLTDDKPASGQSASAAHLETMMAMPIFAGDKLRLFWPGTSRIQKVALFEKAAPR